MGRHLALLRGINVGGTRKVPMARLRELCAGLGWADVATYIQSGNVIFSAIGEPAALERALEEAIAGEFGFDVAVIVRSAAEWRLYPPDNPFPEAARDEPNRLMLHLAKHPPASGAEEAIAAKAAAGERVRRAGHALWIHYPAGAGTTKITPSLLDRAAGSPVTARNWRTVITLMEMVDS
jgi:uncharacterized protein (DUF1697 family)